MRSRFYTHNPHDEDQKLIIKHAEIYNQGTQRSYEKVNQTKLDKVFLLPRYKIKVFAEALESFGSKFRNISFAMLGGSISVEAVINFALVYDKGNKLGASLESDRWKVVRTLDEVINWLASPLDNDIYDLPSDQQKAIKRAFAIRTSSNPVVNETSVMWDDIVSSSSDEEYERVLDALRTQSDLTLGAVEHILNGLPPATAQGSL